MPSLYNFLNAVIVGLHSESIFLSSHRRLFYSESTDLTYRLFLFDNLSNHLGLNGLRLSYFNGFLSLRDRGTLSGLIKES
jgi:hypothetical protein